EVDRSAEPQPGDDGGVPFGVDQGFGQQHLLAALLIVVGGLQHRSALAAVHRPVPEIQLGHYCRYPSSAARRTSSAFLPAGRSTLAYFPRTLRRNVLTVSYCTFMRAATSLVLRPEAYSRNASASPW